MLRIINTLLLLIGLALILAVPQRAQLPINTCYFGVTDSAGTAGLQSFVCTDQAKFTAPILGQVCTPTTGFALMAQLPSGNCLPVQVYAASGVIAQNPLNPPATADWWNRETLGTKTCSSYWTPGIPCITISRHVPGGVQSLATGIPVRLPR